MNTSRQCSIMMLDQAHEQHNADEALVKSKKNLEADAGHQRDFREEVDTMKATGNPFLDEGTELTALDSHIITTILCFHKHHFCNM